MTYELQDSMIPQNKYSVIIPQNKTVIIFQSGLK